MNRLVSIAAGAALSALAVSATAQASTMQNNATAPMMTPAGGHFALLDVGRLEQGTPDYAFYKAAGAGSQASAVQREIEANPTLVRELQAQNVEISNIVAASHAADGSMTFYLR